MVSEALFWTFIVSGGTTKHGTEQKMMLQIIESALTQKHNSYELGLVEVQVTFLSYISDLLKEHIAEVLVITKELQD